MWIVVLRLCILLWLFGIGVGYLVVVLFVVGLLRFVFVG